MKRAVSYNVIWGPCILIRCLLCEIIHKWIKVQKLRNKKRKKNVSFCSFHMLSVIFAWICWNFRIWCIRSALARWVNCSLCANSHFRSKSQLSLHWSPHLAHWSDGLLNKRRTFLLNFIDVFLGPEESHPKIWLVLDFFQLDQVSIENSQSLLSINWN